MGARRREELMKIEINHIEDLNTALVVHIPDTKTKIERQFVIGGNFYKICKKRCGRIAAMVILTLYMDGRFAADLKLYLKR
jgi:hypothetical protein